MSTPHTDKVREALADLMEAVEESNADADRKVANLGRLIAIHDILEKIEETA